MAKISINMKSGELEKQELIVGIDLGTTHSLVAYMNEGQAHLVTDEAGKSSLVPSVIYLGHGGEFIVGNEARSKLVTEPERTIYSVKRLLGKAYSDLEFYRKQLAYEIIDEEDRIIKVGIEGRYYSPVELSAEILKHLKKRVEKATGKTVTKAVITVPAYFNDAQRQATRDAGKLAGLDILRIINEPTAASLAYGLDNEGKDEIIAVYDLGGGTFDISILQLNDGVFEVLATNGDSFLGGDDIDNLIIEHWKKEYDLRDEQIEQDVRLRQSLRLRAEQAKKQLSSATKFESKDGSFSLTRNKLEELIEDLTERTIDKCRDAVKDAGIALTDIHKVVLVGGSTRIPFIKQKVNEFFKARVFDDINPDEVVAVGAAIQADILAGQNAELLLLDITPLSLGIETMGGLMDVIIPRNSKIPHSAARNYTTSVDGQKNLKIAVYQGERDLVEDNRKLGEFILTDIPPMPAGIPKIEVQFIIDADGILKVKARELRSGNETEIIIKSRHGITEEEMARMLLDSLDHAEEDMKEKALREARNEARSIVLSGKKFIKQNEEWMSEKQKNTLSQMIEDLEKSMEEGNKDEINSKMQKINQFSSPLAEKAMNAVISAALKGKNI